MFLVSHCAALQCRQKTFQIILLSTFEIFVTSIKHELFRTAIDDRRGRPKPPGRPGRPRPHHVQEDGRYFYFKLNVKF